MKKYITVAQLRLNASLRPSLKLSLSPETCYANMAENKCLLYCKAYAYALQSLFCLSSLLSLISYCLKTPIFSLPIKYIYANGNAVARTSRTREACEAVNSYRDTDAPVVIAGDFNFPALDRHTAAPILDIKFKEQLSVNCCYNNGLLQLVTCPTHSSGLTLDLIIFSTDSDIITNILTQPSPIMYIRSSCHFL